MKKIIFAVWLVIAGLAPFLLSCCEEIEKPRIVIIDCQNVTDTSVVIVGELISNGGAAILEMGATVYPNRTVIFEGQVVPGRFTVKVDGLVPNTDYQIGVYATNIAGTSSGGWINFTTAEATPVEYKFSIPGTRMTDVITDSQGNIYVAGTFGGMDRWDDCFIARFNADGTLAWRNNIVTEYGDFNRGELLIDENIKSIYIHTMRNDVYRLGGGDPYLDSYNINTGELKWSKPQEGMCRRCVIDNKGRIFVMKLGRTEIINSDGEEIGRYSYLGGNDYVDISFWNNDIWTAGSQSFTVTLFSKFRGDFEEKLWDLSGPKLSQDALVGNIEIFSDDSVIVVSWMKGSYVDNGGITMFITAYEILPGDIFSKIWEKEYPGFYGVDIKQEGRTIYAFSSNVSFTPRAFDLDGKEVWRAPNGYGRLAIFENTIFIAGAGSSLVLN